MYQKTIPMQIITIMYNTYLKIVGTSFNRRNVAVSISLTKMADCDCNMCDRFDGGWFICCYYYRSYHVAS